MRKIGPGDISYCSTNCCQERCKRNLRYWKPPTQFCSMCYFDKDCEDITHPKCEHMWLAEEENKIGKQVKRARKRES